PMYKPSAACVRSLLTLFMLWSALYVRAQIVADTDGIVYVNINVTGSDGSGSSWDNATTDLQGAIDVPGPHMVFVATGNYNIPSPSSFVMRDKVAIYGGFDPDHGISTLADARILPSSAGVGRGSVLNGMNERPVIWNYDNGLTSLAI